MSEASSDRWVDIGPVSAIPDTTPLSVEVDGWLIAVIRCGTQLLAVEHRCTHDGEPLAGAEVESCEIICPRHGARFDLRTGEALTPPAYEPLRTFKVREENGRVLIERPE
jgi:3-phenylpropionate/trans-cinnamate dioxygenase ferredoxin subunit